MDENFESTQLLKENAYHEGFEAGYQFKEQELKDHQHQTVELEAKLEDEKSDLYYAQEGLDSQLKSVLRATRDEPVGLSIYDIANVIKKVFEKEEAKQLIKRLKYLYGL